MVDSGGALAALALACAAIQLQVRGTFATKWGQSAKVLWCPPGTTPDSQARVIEVKGPLSVKDALGDHTETEQGTIEGEIGADVIK